MPPPVDSMKGRWSMAEESRVNQMTRVSAVGARDTIRQELEAILDATQADELILTAQIHDHAARLRSFEIAADVCKQLATPAPAKP
jgi:alkanesulfonate monooxygenase SsuD/methylene tetrahydromethanopterin reductase-like flavin-dependent oxidoreductase (luciferase family)